MPYLNLRCCFICSIMAAQTGAVVVHIDLLGAENSMYRGLHYPSRTVYSETGFTVRKTINVDRRVSELIYYQTGAARFNVTANTGKLTWIWIWHEGAAAGVSDQPIRPCICMAERAVACLGVLVIVMPVHGSKGMAGSTLTTIR